MKVFVLILLLHSSPYGNITFPAFQEFSSGENCLTAGKFISDKGNADWACVEK